MTFQATLLTPEGPIFQQKVERLHLPGEDGELEILKHHTPLILSLVPGVVVFKKADDKKHAQKGLFFIWGGVADIRLKETTLLVSRTCPLLELSRLELEQKISDLLEKITDENDIEKIDKIQKELHITHAQTAALDRYI